MNAGAPCESAVRTSPIPSNGRRSWGNCPPHFEKLRGVKTIFPLPLFGTKFKKKKLLQLTKGQGYKDMGLL